MLWGIQWERKMKQQHEDRGLLQQWRPWTRITAVRNDSSDTSLGQLTLIIIYLIIFFFNQSSFLVVFVTNPTYGCPEIYVSITNSCHVPEPPVHLQEPGRGSHKSTKPVDRCCFSLPWRVEYSRRWSSPWNGHLVSPPASPRWPANPLNSFVIACLPRRHSAENAGSKPPTQQFHLRAGVCD